MPAATAAWSDSKPDRCMPRGILSQPSMAACCVSRMPGFARERCGFNDRRGQEPRQTGRNYGATPIEITLHCDLECIPRACEIIPSVTLQNGFLGGWGHHRPGVLLDSLRLVALHPRQSKRVTTDVGKSFVTFHAVFPCERIKAIRRGSS